MPTFSSHAPPPRPHAWVQVTSARGPTECQWAAARLADVLAAEAEAAGLAVSRLDWVEGDQPGCALSVLLGLEGPSGGEAALAAFLRGWVGPVRWSARSPFRPEHKRRNWFVGVGTLAVPVKLHWTERELHWDTMRASGPGGQNVNKTESAVRLTHVPTGLSVVAREERSQHQNRRLALARLAALFDAQGRALQGKAAQDRWAQHDDLERGNPVRLYAGPDFTRAV